MSRTYRKTKSKHGAPKWSQKDFSKYQLSLINIPLPKRPPNKYVLVHEVVPVCADHQPPQRANDPRWCTKGQPGAIPEYTTEYKQVVRYVNGLPQLISWPIRKESGRYYLPKPATTVEITRHKRVYEPTNWADNSWRLQWKHQDIVEHVFKNNCGRSRKSHAFYKCERIRDMRREGKRQVMKWEDEYHKNQHLEPYSWVLDGDQYEPEWDDDWDFDDDYNSSWNDYCDYCGRHRSKCHCDDYDDHDYGLDYDPWDDWHIPDDRRVEVRNHNPEPVAMDSGKSLGDILAEIQRHKEA